MTDRDGTEDGRGDGAEDELRVLLERAVPQLPAPPQRLQRVRERVRRRRRRRTAVVTGSAVLAVAAGLVALPGLHPQGGAAPVVVATSGRAERPATPSASVPQPTPTGTPTPSAEDDGYRPPGMDGLRVRLPAGWQTLPDSATSSVFVSSQALVLPVKGCRHALDEIFCTPLVRALGSGGVLVMFELRHDLAAADKLRAIPTPIGEEQPYKACRTVGGTRQLSGTIVDLAGSSTVVRVTVCLAQPSPARLAQAKAVVTSADFG